jgi:peptidoglycan/LPS O-acetylase OafA/YrhL
VDNRRYFGLDALRGGMMLLGIVLHAAEFYVSRPPPQFVGMPIDPSTSYLFDLTFHFIHSFRMPLFFVLAGFFAALLVEKRGMWGTYKDRAARIAAPMAAAVFTILPLTVLVFLGLAVEAFFGIRELLPSRASLEALRERQVAVGAPVDQPTILHLWFLLYLCYFYLLLPVCRVLARASARFEMPIAPFLRSPAALVILGLYTAATLWPFRGGQVIEGFLFLKPHPPSMLYYGSFFVLGYLFQQHREVLKVFARYAPGCTLAAAVLFPLSVWLSELEYAGGGSHLAAVVANGLCTWALIYAFAGWTLRLFDRESPWVLYVSQSAYWVYLIHLPLVIAAAWLVLPYDFPAVVKFAIVATAATVGCFASYHYLVRSTWLGRFLHGKRFHLDWPWRVRVPEKVSMGA